MAVGGSDWWRPTAVAGSFYPASAGELRAELAGFAAAAADGPARQPVWGAVCPHAGYLYAGALAYRTLAACELPETVVILAVNHRHPNPPPWAIWPEGAWQTPLGDVPVNAALAAALMQAIPEWTPSRSSHEQDHATEVLLPMLQTLRGAAGVQIVPVVPFVNRATEASVVDVGRRLARALAAWPQPVLVVASNDMTHFAPAAEAERQDRKALAAMAAVDGAALLQVARRERITMCGAQPVATMLAAAQARGGRRGRLVGYTHSGVVTGDNRNVVAYAGMVIE